MHQCVTWYLSNQSMDIGLIKTNNQSLLRDPWDVFGNLIDYFHELQLLGVCRVEWIG